MQLQRRRRPSFRGRVLSGSLELLLEGEDGAETWFALRVAGYERTAIVIAKGTYCCCACFLGGSWRLRTVFVNYYSKMVLAGVGCHRVAGACTQQKAAKPLQQSAGIRGSSVLLRCRAQRNVRCSAPRSRFTTRASAAAPNMEDKRIPVTVGVMNSAACSSLCY